MLIAARIGARVDRVGGMPTPLTTMLDAHEIEAAFTMAQGIMLEEQNRRRGDAARAGPLPEPVSGT
jgi:hypothetical protein